jgi:hypothetical protein
MKNATGAALALAVLACTVAAPASAARNPLNVAAAAAALQPQGAATVGEIQLVDPATLNCVQTTTFDDIAGGLAPGTNYDVLLPSVGVIFGERFQGQTLGFAGDFDVISGSPSNPLTPQAGSPGQNLNVFDYSTNVLTGLGPLGFPDFNAIGEGSISMYFTTPQSQFGFSLVGGDGGSATLDFYRADGSLIDTITLSGLANLSYGFARTGGIQDISGVLIQNNDGAGIGLDNVCHDVPVVPTKAASWGQLKSVYR